MDCVKTPKTGSTVLCLLGEYDEHEGVDVRVCHLVWTAHNAGEASQKHTASMEHLHQPYFCFKSLMLPYCCYTWWLLGR